MYMIAIAWLYVALMMSITETSVIAGIMTFVFYGVAPLSVVLYIVDAPRRRKHRQHRAMRAQDTLRHQQPHQKQEQQQSVNHTDCR
jgi:hypothetical protein